MTIRPSTTWTVSSYSARVNDFRNMRMERWGTMDKQQEFALRTVEERDVRFIRLWFTDVLGTLKSVAIAPAELRSRKGSDSTVPQWKASPVCPKTI